MLLLILLTEGRTRNLHTWQKYDAKHTHTEISLSQQNAHYAKSMGLRKFGEGGSLSACFSSSLHLKSLEQKKKKHQSSWKCLEETLRPWVFLASLEKIIVWILFSSGSRETQGAMAKQRGVLQLEMKAIPQLSGPGIVFREVLHLSTNSTGSGGPAHF